MGTIVLRNQPCIACPSSDGRQVYADGGSRCFSCSRSFRADDTPKPSSDELKAEEEAANKWGSDDQATDKMKPQKKKNFTLIKSEIEEFRHRGFEERKILSKTAKFYDVRVSFNKEGVISAHYYPYANGATWQVKVMPKEFWWVNKTDTLFGRERFSNGGKRVIVTEGVLDCLAMAEISQEKYSTIYPTVAIASSSDLNCLITEREFLRSFDNVVLCFDSDDAGREAAKKAAKIVGYDKALIAVLPEGTDICDNRVLPDGVSIIMRAIFDAQTYMPAGIMQRAALWEALISVNNIVAHPYPACMAGVNKLLKGKRFGEIALFISGTGCGKSTLLREIVVDVLETTIDTKVGVVELEEAPSGSARKLSAMAISKNPAVEEIPLSELKVGFDKVFGADRVSVLDHQGAVGDSTIMDHLEFLCLTGHQYIMLDHITILTSEGADNLKGLEAQDKVMNDLLRLVKKYPVWIGLVSHLRKAQVGKTSFEDGGMPSLDDIRGSGSIKQISFDVIAFARKMSDGGEQANKMRMAVLKARTTGNTGPGGSATFNEATGRINAEEAYHEGEFTVVGDEEEVEFPDRDSETLEIIEEYTG
jgi:twinkle protein